MLVHVLVFHMRVWQAIRWDAFSVEQCYILHLRIYTQHGGTKKSASCKPNISNLTRCILLPALDRNGSSLLRTTNVCCCTHAHVLKSGEWSQAHGYHWFFLSCFIQIELAKIKIRLHDACCRQKLCASWRFSNVERRCSTKMQCHYAE